MLRKFAAASLVASCLIAAGGVALIAFRLIASQRYYSIAVLWCLVPVVWGVWAVLMPKSWFPGRLFVWGAILGLIAYIGAVFVINVPIRVLGLALPVWAKVSGFVVAPAIYGAVWMLIGPAYRALSPENEPAKVQSKAA